jgi:endonuclease/exonuclease/phosphatase family metal-dependent hydrolase
MSFLALAFPILTVVMVMLTVLWAFIEKKVAIFLFVLFLLAGYKNLASTWGTNIFTKFSYEKDTAALRVMCWNVRYFDNNARHADSLGAPRRKMINYIREIGPDLILFQDFGNYTNPAYFSNIETIRDTLGYRYCFIAHDFIDPRIPGGVSRGSAIFSKIPITDSGKLPYKNIAEPETLCYADMIFQKKKIRVYTTHLISMNLPARPGIRSEIRRKKYDQSYRYSRNVTKLIRHYDQVHAKQAQFIKAAISKSPYPSIIGGDFNSVPSSYVYHTIKGNKQDAFIEKGFGLGHSYYGLSKTLRIDYVLADDAFKVLQVATPTMYLSDHFPIITDISWAE